MSKGSGEFESWTLALSAFAGSRQSAPAPLVNASTGPHAVATDVPGTCVHRDRKAAPSQYTLWQPDNRNPRQRQKQPQQQQRQRQKPSLASKSNAECIDASEKPQLSVRVLARSTRKEERDSQDKNADVAGSATGLASSSLTEKQKAYLEARRKIFGD
ncbi:hypothetical protein FB645_000693 [Coemansia sp. IMI 203386]|nr:hypothetical protein FB645_000693 [Coemansia sp. IMI 203386]